jgi:hypothetical protein
MKQLFENKVDVLHGGWHTRWQESAQVVSRDIHFCGLSLQDVSDEARYISRDLVVCDVSVFT